MTNQLELTVLLVGIGGYGENYVHGILAKAVEKNVRIAGAVDPYAAQSPAYGALLSQGIPVYDTLEAFFASSRADLAVICTPIYLHARQGAQCMEQGCHVLVEKPIAATSAEARAMISLRDRTQRLLAVGYQWCYDPAMLALKADVDAGRFGRPVSMRAMVLWPRGYQYYARGTGWAGKKYTQDGQAVFDNVVSNATAHYLENMLWLTGHSFGGTTVVQMEAETWRANPIEMFDTACMRMTFANGCKALFLASHAIGVAEEQPPVFEYAFEKATICYGGIGQKGSGLTAITQENETIAYGKTNPSDDVNLYKFWHVVRVLREGLPCPCPAEAALAHTLAMEALYAAVPEAQVFPFIAKESDRLWVPGLRDQLAACYQNWALLSEGCPLG